MHAIAISSFGSPDVLHLVERPDPQPGPGEVLIKVAAAGVNRPDLMQRQGHYPPPKGASDLPGLRSRGHIVALGTADDGGGPRSGNGRLWRVGDRVCALVSGGGYATMCAAPGVQCLPMPHGLTPLQAAAIPEDCTSPSGRTSSIAGTWRPANGCSSTAARVESERPRFSSRRARRARGRHRRLRRQMPRVRTPRRRGRDQLQNPRLRRRRPQPDRRPRRRRRPRYRRGEPYTAKNFECLALNGRLVQIGVMGGSTAEVSLRTMLVKRLTMTASTLRARTPAEKGDIAAALEREIWPLLESGRATPVVHAAFPLEAAADAHRMLESGEVIGKVVLTID